LFAANSTRPVFKIELLRVKIIFEPRLFVGKFFLKKSKFQENELFSNIW
jgi:hypothetical protein